METIMKIKLNTVNDIKEFVNRAMMCEFDIDLISGRYIIDAKSIMGIFSLDLSKPINLAINEIHANDIDLVMFKKWEVNV